MLSFMPTFTFSSFTFIRRLSSTLLSAVRVVSSAYLRLLIFLLAILIILILIILIIVGGQSIEFLRCN